MTDPLLIILALAACGLSAVAIWTALDALRIARRAERRSEELAQLWLQRNFLSSGGQELLSDRFEVKS